MPSSGARRKAVAIDMHATLAMVVPATPATSATVDAVSFATSGRERLVPLASIRRDPRAQPRARLSPETVEAYRAAMALGEGEPAWGTFPAVVLYQEGNVYHLADGFHRLAAAEAAGLEQARAEVRAGGLRDAILYSVGANATHGLPRTNEDKRRAVLALLHDGIWSQWSDRAIAQKAAVSHPFVASVRTERAHEVSTGNGFQSTPVAPVVVSTGNGFQSTPVVASTGNGFQSGPASSHEETPAEGRGRPVAAGRERIGRDGRTIKTDKIGRAGASRAPSASRSSAAAVDPLDQALAELARASSELEPMGRMWLAEQLRPVVAKLRRRRRG